MKYLILILFTLNLIAQEQFTKDVITDPTVSFRCKHLIEERNEKISIQQRLNSLAQRNIQMLKQVPENKKQALMQLRMTKTQLNNEIRLSNLKVRAMEENIIRKGCPGMKL